MPLVLKFTMAYSRLYLSSPPATMQQFQFGPDEEFGVDEQGFDAHARSPPPTVAPHDPWPLSSNYPQDLACPQGCYGGSSRSVSYTTGDEIKSGTSSFHSKNNATHDARPESDTGIFTGEKFGSFVSSASQPSLQTPTLQQSHQKHQNASDSRPVIQSPFLERKSSRFAPTWVVAFLTLGITAVTVYYSARVMVNTAALPNVLQLTPAATVLAVNVLSHIVSFLCFSLFNDVFESMRWALACRDIGIPLTSFLAMSRATPILGVFYLCKVWGTHQFWAIQR